MIVKCSHLKRRISKTHFNINDGRLNVKIYLRHEQQNAIKAIMFNIYVFRICVYYVDYRYL